MCACVDGHHTLMCKYVGLILSVIEAVWMVIIHYNKISNIGMLSKQRRLSLIVQAYHKVQ